VGERGGREGEGVVARKKSNEREGEGARIEGLGAGPGRAGSRARMEAHNTHDHGSESNCESKSETRRDEHAIKHNTRQKKYASA
jgi:hypothetical protein